jgi:uncharacterized membrane protein
MKNMLRDKLISRHTPDEAFRWRSHEIMRIEGFSDAVFGFIVTLLIVSLEVPKTSTELLVTLASFGPFIATFFLLASIWYAQFKYFRRYGMEDTVTVVLNLVLLFTVLFFAYPLKFLFTILLTHPHEIIASDARSATVLPEHRPIIIFIFALGFIAVFGVFILLYRHAYKKRDILGLNEHEIYETRHMMRSLATSLGVGASYILMGFMSMLPMKTKADKLRFVGVDLLFLAILMFLLFLMIKLMKERNAHRKAWIAQQAGLPVDSTTLGETRD